MRVLRWVFLTFYVLLLVGFIGVSMTTGDEDLIVSVMICLAVIVMSQAMFIFGAGTVQLCRPIRKRRLLLPIFASSIMLLVLMAGFLLAMSELLEWALDSAIGVGIVVILYASWMAWGVLLFNHAQRWPRYRVLSRISGWLFTGSLAELLATIPAHLIVIRRPGCLVGVATMLGIVAGVGVMIFSFGPMIVVLFLRPRYRAERAMGTQFCEACGYDLRASRDRCPECGQPFTGASGVLPSDPSQP